MRSQLRNWDSKITFFAFADIITAVSGMLIFITLLLATDLGRPTGDRAANSQLEQQLQQTLAQQATVDAQNSRLRDLLSRAEIAPNLEKLQADVARLRSQLAEEKQKQTAIAGRLAGSRAAAETRDARLGLADLGAAVDRVLQEAETAARHESEVRGAMDGLERQVERLQSTLLKLRQREGQLWLIPDKSATTKEPILVTVGGAGAVIERFDHPEQRKQLDKAGADSVFKSYLREAKALDQYVVFLVRPSGIGLFQDLVQSARGAGFEVGYDALEEDRQIHFSTPPGVDEPRATNWPAVTPDQKSSAPAGNFAPPAKAAKAASIEPAAKGSEPQPAGASVNPAPRKKSWWQRLLEWLGLA
jgi:hypothetical protein